MTTVRARRSFLWLMVISVVCSKWLGSGTSGHLWGQTLLLRFPDIHGGQVVFCYGGDLWRASAKGGTAIRLTAHPGQELFPKFSPDGKWIAFTGQYDGDEQVYVIPAEGGEPQQLTFYPARGPLAPRWGYDNQVYGWTPDGKSILFRSLRDADGGRTETALYVVDRQGGLPRKLPMPTSGAGDFSPDGKRIVYSPLFRDFRTWKRYQGGWAQDLYIFHLATHRAERIAHSVRTERDPMWIGQHIYFVSDRDGTLNLYRYGLADGKVEQLTHSKVYDVRWASSDNKRWIVYELNGSLVVYDTRSGEQTTLEIHVPDDGLARRPGRYPADKQLEGFGLSPHGERALFVARGDVFTAPIERGPTRNLTNSSDAHDRAARWSPDGRWIAFISDRSGEDQLYLVPQDGSSPAEQITHQFEGMLFSPEWAPDGRRIALSDKYGKLYVVTLADKSVVEIADERRGLLRDFSWSPCGQHLAFVLSDANQFGSIYIWSVQDGQVRRVTDEWYDESNPAWDPDGNYLFFLARRQFAPQISTVEWNYAGNRDTAILAVTLRKDVPHLFPPRSDEVRVEVAPERSGQGENKPVATSDTGGKGSATRIDFEGIGQRVIRVPVDEDNIGRLHVVKGYLVFSKRSAPFYGREGYQRPKIQIFDIEKREESTLHDGSDSFVISYDGKKILIRQGNQFLLMDVRPKATEKKTVSTSELMVDRIPRQEWETIFEEVWRRYRDFFYVRNMHGYDWKAIGERYRALLPHVAHRSDLNYVLGEMVAELNAGHCYIQGGDYEIPPRPRVGLPGARFELDAEAGRYRIARIFRGDNAEGKYRAPLAELGIDVREGDYVLAIDGVDLKGNDNPYRLLRHKTHPVTLTVNDRPTMEGARKITYDPIFSEENLLYYEWVRSNREYVTQKTEGRVGYLHIPDMGADGIYEFIKWYYPQIRKEGLIIDVRSNGGGNVSQWILERLDNKLLGTRFGSLSDEPATYPSVVFHGHMVCLINETSASDGDIFPYRFRQAGLGPLIGKRTWGGVVGITSLGPLLDGGEVFVPLSATNAPSGEWIIEGHGVDPDIEVENDPLEVIAGRDPQLDRAIAEVMRRIEQEPKRLPSRPPDPVKTP
ncbi:MAG: tricorn protease [Pirellulaceae bacterium]|nr:MAG: tricorn protease [Pirellulaceae bacterium]